MDPEIANYMAEKQKKQDFLLIEIVNKQYNQIEFAQYIDSKKRTSLFHLYLLANGTEIDNWTLDELMDVVHEFQIYYGDPNLQANPSPVQVDDQP